MIYMRTPKNIIRHELIGLNAEVVEAKNKDIVGIKGRIIDETQKTFTLETKKGIKKIQKGIAKFKLSFDKFEVIVDGKSLFGRPEDRIKKKIKDW